MVFQFSLGYNYTVKEINKDIKTLFEVVPKKHPIRVGEDIHEIDMERLLKMTAMIESNYAGDKARVKAVAKTYMQIEPISYNFYIGRANELKKYFEKELGRTLNGNNNKDAMFISYIFYMSKLEVHSRWLVSYKNTLHYKHGDIDYYIYKIFYNSIKGKTTYSTWLRRERELEILNKEVIK